MWLFNIKSRYFNARKVSVCADIYLFDYLCYGVCKNLYVYAHGCSLACGGEDARDHGMTHSLPLINVYSIISYLECLFFACLSLTQAKKIVRGAVQKCLSVHVYCHMSSVKGANWWVGGVRRDCVRVGRTPPNRAIWCQQPKAIVEWMTIPAAASILSLSIYCVS